MVLTNHCPAFRGCCCAFLLSLSISATFYGQVSGKTIRHHTVAESNSSLPELAQAEAAIEKQEYVSAEPLLIKVTDKDPSNYVGWFDLGFVANALGKQEESIAAYRQSVAAKPDVFESNLNLGIVLARTGQLDAEKYLRAAILLKPTARVEEGRARAWLALGHVLEKTDPEAAIKAYQESSRLQTLDAEPHLSAGALLEQANRFAEAESEYKNVLQIDPRSSDAMTGLANVYIHENRISEAASALHKLLELRPQDSSLHAQLGRLLGRNGENEAAISELQTAAKAAPADMDVERDLAELYVTTAKLEQAEPLFRSLLSTHPDDPELHHSLGLLLLKRNQFPEAQQELLQAVKLKPDSGVAYGDLAAAANGNKDYALAIRAIDARAKFMPELPITFFLRATAYDHLRQYKPAAENYHKFLQAANGQYPDQEWQARHRLITIEPKR